MSMYTVVATAKSRWPTVIRGVAQKAMIAHSLRERVWPLLESGKVKPIIHATFPLAEANEAHRMMESSRHIGKIVLSDEN